MCQWRGFEPAAVLLLLAVTHPGRGLFSLITDDPAPMTGRRWRNKSSAQRIYLSKDCG